MEEFNLRVFLMMTQHLWSFAIGHRYHQWWNNPDTGDRLFSIEVIPARWCIFWAPSGKGPRVFMTDNCMELKDAIHQVWPDATTVLCIFHLLQQVWRWLHDKKHGIALEDRPHILLAALCWRWGGVPSRLYNLLQNEVALKYPNFATYATAVYEDCESWALC